jgi:hypothetical protein
MSSSSSESSSSESSEVVPVSFTIAILRLIHANLTNMGVNHNPYISQDEELYPFVNYSMPDITLSPDNAFDVDYEKIRVRFEIFSKADSPQEVITIMKSLEKRFYDDDPALPYYSNNMKLVCSHVANAFFDKLGLGTTSVMWRGTIDFYFTMQRDCIRHLGA